MVKIQIPVNSAYEPLRAVELANLIDRAYQQFDYHQERSKAFKEGKTLPFWREILQDQIVGSTLVKPELEDKVLKRHELDHASNLGKVVYKLLATFSYTGYWIGKPGKVPFGFIAQRTLENSVLGVFIVFRGTRVEPEWVSNLQYAQVPFLENVLERRDLGLVSKGFNKIYTRPHPSEIEKMHREFPGNAVLKVRSETLFLKRCKTIHPMHKSMSQDTV